jgi:hypothetical protein
MAACQIHEPSQSVSASKASVSSQNLYPADVCEASDLGTKQVFIVQLRKCCTAVAAVKSSDTMNKGSTAPLVAPSVAPRQISTPPIPLAVGELSATSDYFSNIRKENTDIDVQHETTVAKKNRRRITAVKAVAKSEWSNFSEPIGPHRHGVEYGTTSARQEVQVEPICDTVRQLPASKRRKVDQEGQSEKHIERVVTPSPVSRYGDHCYYLCKKD